jgi:8-oxo-dGTP pyrophosphatase MutT (NUDIX family)
MQDPILLAGCVLLDDYGRLLLLHRNTDETVCWEMPGGKVDEDELPEDTAVREIREELGVQVVIQKPLGKATFEQDEQYYEYHWFLATPLSGDLDTLHIMEPETFDDLDFVDIEDLPSLALSTNMLELQQRLLTGEVEL